MEFIIALVFPWVSGFIYTMNKADDIDAEFMPDIKCFMMAILLWPFYLYLLHEYEENEIRVKCYFVPVFSFYKAVRMNATVYGIGWLRISISAKFW